jgi:hypothetical protein
MSRATASPPARIVAVFAATVIVAVAAAFALGVSPAEAAKPCWKRVVDDWLDNSRIDGTYSARCYEEALRHLPEDIRAYSNIEDAINSARRAHARTPQSRSIPDAAGELRNERVEDLPEPRDRGPIPSALGYNTNDTDSIPLPLIVLAALSLLLLAAGGAGFGARKLQARKLPRDTGKRPG